MSALTHSDYQIRWKNYRRFVDTQWVTLRPITVIIGANNSGKTSVMTPLLLLKQTLASPDSKTPLISTGPIVDVGGYKDYVHAGDPAREVFFGVRHHIHSPTNKTKPVGRYPPGTFEVTFSSVNAGPQVRLKRYDVFDIFNRHYFSRHLGADGRYDLSGIIPLEKMKKAEQMAVRETRPTNFFFTAAQTLRLLDGSETNDEPKLIKDFSGELQHYLMALTASVSGFRTVLDDLSYIGPLRERPRRFYRISGETPQTVGTQGENAPNVLYGQFAQLRERINAWVRKFEFGDSVSCETITDDLFALKFVSGSESMNIADAGFGASQVLPLIIQALAAPEDSLTLAEQPEIHLNPKLQGVLAELFVQMAKTGHRVVMETHSEHLLLRLRTLVAQGEIDADNVAIYFVERSGSESIIRPVEIDSNGRIAKDTWPKNFFDDALRESLMLATAQSKAPRRAQ